MEFNGTDLLYLQTSQISVFQRILSTSEKENTIPSLKNRFGFRKTKGISSPSHSKSTLKEKKSAATTSVLPINEKDVIIDLKYEPSLYIRDKSKTAFSNISTLDKLMVHIPGSKLPKYAYKERIAKVNQYMKRLKDQVKILLENKDEFIEECCKIEYDLVSNFRHAEKSHHEMKTQVQDLQSKTERLELELSHAMGQYSDVCVTIEEKENELLNEKKKKQTLKDELNETIIKLKSTSVNLEKEMEMNSEKDRRLVALTSSCEMLKIKFSNMENKIKSEEEEHEKAMEMLRATITQEKEAMIKSVITLSVTWTG